MSPASARPSERRRVDSSEFEDAVDLDHWCVELDDEIECLSTRQVWMGLARGRLRPETPVWRDGLGHWVAIYELPEFTAEPVDDEDPVSVPERSEIRVRRVALPVRTTLPEDRPSATVAARLRAMVAAAVVASGRVIHRVGQRVRRVVLVLPRAFAWRKVGAGLAFLVASASAVSGVVLVSRADGGTVPRAQRVAVDVAERARFVSAKVRTKTIEREQAWWQDRWR